MSEDFVEALIECLRYVLRANGSPSNWLAIPSQRGFAHISSWKAATSTILRWGSNQAFRDVATAGVFEELLVLFLSLGAPSQRSVVLAELTKYAAVATHPKNRVLELLVQLTKVPPGVSFVLLERNLKKFAEVAPSTLGLDVDVPVTLSISRDFFRFAVAAPTLMGGVLVSCLIEMNHSLVPLLVCMFRSSFGLIIKSYIDYARGIAAGIMMVSGSPNLPPAFLIRKFLVEPFADGKISGEVLLGPHVAEIVSVTQSHFSRMLVVPDAPIIFQYIDEFFFSSVRLTPNDETLLALNWKLMIGAVNVISSPALLLKALRFGMKQLDNSMETVIALKVLELLSSKLFEVARPSAEDLLLVLADSGESLFTIYARSYDAANALKVSHVLRPHWLGVAKNIFRALVSWEPESQVSTDRLPSVNGELVLEVWSAFVDGGLSFLHRPTLHVILREVASAGKHLLLESLLLDEVHSDNLVALGSTQTMHAVLAVLNANWGSFRHALRLASKFLHLTSTSSSRSVLHTSVCKSASLWLLGLPEESSAPLPVCVTDGTMVSIANVLSETTGLASMFVGAILQLGTPRALIWVSHILEQLRDHNEGDIAGNPRETIIPRSLECTLFRYLDDPSLRDQAASILRAVRGVSFGNQRTTSKIDKNPLLGNVTTDRLFHEAASDHLRDDGNAVESLAVASKRSPYAVDWLKDASKGWSGDATIAEQLHLRDLIPENSDLVLTQTTKKNMLLVAQSRIDPTPILLVGQSGTSKTFTVCQTATLMQRTKPKMKFLRINLHSQMTDEDFFGRYISTKSTEGSEQLEFVLQPFARGYQEGHWVLLDELNLASAAVFVRLESALSSKSIVVDKGVIYRHRDFRIFATMNPDTGKYADKRSTLSGQLVNLFRQVHLQALPKDEWVEILQHPKHLNDSRLAAQVVDFAKKLEVDLRDAERGNYSEITIRELLRFSDSMKEVERRTGECRSTVLPWVVWCVFGARYRQCGTQKAVHDAMEQSFKVSCSNYSWIDKAIKGVITSHAATTESSHEATICDDVEKCVNVYAVMRATVELTFIGESYFALHGLYIIPSVWWCSESIARKLAAAEVHNGEKAFTQRIQRDVQTILSMLWSDKARQIVLEGIRAVKELNPYFCASLFFFEDKPALRRTPIVMTKSMTQYWRTLYVAMQLPFPLLVTGGDGQGKASLLLSIASVLRHSVEVYNLTPETDSNELMGQYVVSSDPSLGRKITWMDGKVTEAVRRGGILLLTNVSGADPKLLERLNPVLERDPKLVLQEHLVPSLSSSDISGTAGSKMEAEDVTQWYQHHMGQCSPFRLFSTLTTSQLNSGAELSPALFNRYTIVNIEPPQSMEEKQRNLKAFVKVLLQDHPLLQLEFVAEDACTQRETFTPLSTELAMQSVSNRMIVRVLKLMLTLATCREMKCHEGLAVKALAAAYGTDGTGSPVVSALIGALGPLQPHRFEFIKTSDQYLVPTKYVCRFDRIVSCIKAGVPILLEGPPSTGKTEIIRELSRVTTITGASNTLENVINSSSTTSNDYWGSHSLGSDGAIAFCDGPFARALRHGYWMLVDELNLALPEVLDSLLVVMDGALFATNPITQEQVPINPNFRLFATQNPSTDHGRSTLPDSIVKRFSLVSFSVFEADELEQIIRHCFPTFAQHDPQSPGIVAKLMSGSNSGVTMRHIRKWANRLTQLRCVAGTAELQFVLDVGNTLLPLSCAPGLTDGNKHSNRHSISDVQPNSAKFRMCGVFVVLRVTMHECDVWKREPDIEKWPGSFRKSLVELAFAMHCGEPVLLVGLPSFKSLLVRTWSQVTGQRRITSYLTRETEVADLIGSVKPVSQPQLLQELQSSVIAVRNSCTEDTIAVGLCDDLMESIRDVRVENAGLEDAQTCVSTHSPVNSLPVSSELCEQVPAHSLLRNLTLNLASTDDDWSWELCETDNACGSNPTLEVAAIHAECDELVENSSMFDVEKCGCVATAPPPELHEIGSTQWICKSSPLQLGELPKSRNDEISRIAALLVRYLRSYFSNHALLLRVERLAKELGCGDPDQPAFFYVDGPVLQATSEGLMLVLEDFDGATASTVERLNPLAETERRLHVPEDVQGFETIPGKSAPVARKQFIAPAFQLVGTAHAHDKLSPATKSRYTILYIEAYSISEMHEIVRPLFTQAHVPIDCVALFERLEQCAATFCWATRDLRRLERWAAYICDGDVCETWRLRTVYGARVFYCEGVPRAEEKRLLATFCSAVGEEFLNKNMTEMLLGFKAVPMEVKKISDFFCKYPGDWQSRIVVTCSGLDLPKDVLADRIFNPTQEFAIQLAKSAFTPSVVELFEKMFAVLGVYVRVDPKKRGRRSPLLLVGPPGRGKTKFAQFVAELLGYSFRRFNFSGDTSKEDIFGSIRPVAEGGKRSFAFRLGELAKAVDQGTHVILLDELNLANTEVLDALAMCLDTSNNDLIIPESGQRAFPLDDIVFIASINPPHVGGGRKPLPRSIANLFTRIELDAYTFDELRLIGDDMLKPLCVQTDDRYIGIHSDLREKILDCFRKVNGLIDNKDVGGGLSEVRGLRDVCKIVEMIRNRLENKRQANALQLDDSDSDGDIDRGDFSGSKNTSSQVCGDPVPPHDPNEACRLRAVVSERLLSRFLVSVFVSSFREASDRKRVEETVLLALSGAKESAHFDPPLVTGSTVTVGTVTLTRSTHKVQRLCQERFVYTNKTLADLESIMSPISTQRPVLVCGSLASGKSSTIMEIARLCNREVLLIGGHSELDVSDIIGSISPDPLNAVERMHLLAVEMFDKLSSLLLVNPVFAGPSTGKRLSELLQFLSSFNWAEAPLHNAKEELMVLPQYFKNVMSSAPGVEGHAITDVMTNNVAELESLRLSDWKPGFDFQRSAFVDAMYSGKWVIFDNVNAAPQNVVERLLPLLEEEPMLDLYESNKGIVLRHRSHRHADPNNFIHPDFRLFFTADLDRAECPKLSAAFVDRLIVVHFDSDKLASASPDVECDAACGDADAKFQSTEMCRILSGLWTMYTGIRDDTVAIEITRYYAYAAVKENERVADRLISTSRLSFRTALHCLQTAAALVKKFSVATHAAVAIAISQTFIERTSTVEQEEMYSHLHARASKYWPTEKVDEHADVCRRKNEKTQKILDVMTRIEILTAIACGDELGHSSLVADSATQLLQSAQQILSVVFGTCNTPTEASEQANVRAATLAIPAASALSQIVHIFDTSDDIFAKLDEVVTSASYADCRDREELCRRTSFAASTCASALEPIRNTAREARELLRALAKLAFDSAERLASAEPALARRLRCELESVQGLDHLHLELERQYWSLQIPACGLQLQTLLQRDVRTKQLLGYDQLRHVAQVYVICALAWRVVTVTPLIPETPFLLSILHCGEMLTVCIKYLRGRMSTAGSGLPQLGRTLDVATYRRNFALRLLQFSLVPHRFGGRALLERNPSEAADGIGSSIFDFARNDLILLGSTDLCKRSFMTVAVLIQLLAVTDRMRSVCTIVVDGRDAVAYRQVVARATSVVVVVVVLRSGGIAIMQLRPPTRSDEEKPVVVALCFLAAPTQETEVVPSGHDASLEKLIDALGCTAHGDVIRGSTSDVTDTIRKFFDVPSSCKDLSLAAKRATQKILKQAMDSRIASEGLIQRIIHLFVEGRNCDSLLRDFVAMRDSLDKDHAFLVRLFSRLALLIAPSWSSELLPGSTGALNLRVGLMCSRVSHVIFSISMLVFAEGGLQFRASDARDSLTHLVAISDTLATVTSSGDPVGALRRRKLEVNVRSAFHAVLPDHSLDFGNIQLDALVDDLANEISTAVAMFGGKRLLDGALDQAVCIRRDIVHDLDCARNTCEGHTPQLNQELDEIARWKAEICDTCVESWTDVEYAKFRNRMHDFGTRVRALVGRLQEIRVPPPSAQPADVQALEPPRSFGTACGTPMSKIAATCYADSTFSTMPIEELMTNFQELRRRWNQALSRPLKPSIVDVAEFQQYRERVLGNPGRFQTSLSDVHRILVGTLRAAPVIHSFVFEQQLQALSTKLRMWERTHRTRIGFKSAIPSVIVPEAYLLADVAFLCGAEPQVVADVLRKEIVAQEALLGNNDLLDVQIRSDDVPDFGPAILGLIGCLHQPSLHFDPRNRVIIGSLVALAASMRLTKNRFMNLKTEVKSFVQFLFDVPTVEHSIEHADIANAIVAKFKARVAMMFTTRRFDQFKDCLNEIAAHPGDAQMLNLQAIKGFAAAIPGMCRDVQILGETTEELSGALHEQRQQLLLPVQRCASSLTVSLEAIDSAKKSKTARDPVACLDTARASLLKSWSSSLHYQSCSTWDVIHQCDILFCVTKLLSIAAILEEQLGESCHVAVERILAASEAIGRSYGVPEIAKCFDEISSDSPGQGLRTAGRSMSFMPSITAAFGIDFSFAFLDTWSTTAALRLRSARAASDAIRSGTKTLRDFQHAGTTMEAEMSIAEVRSFHKLNEQLLHTKVLTFNVVTRDWAGLAELQCLRFAKLADELADSIRLARGSSAGPMSSYRKELSRHFAAIDQRLLGFGIRRRVDAVLEACHDAERTLVKSLIEGSNEVVTSFSMPLGAFLYENPGEYSLPSNVSLPTSVRSALYKPRTRLRLAIFSARRAADTLHHTLREQTEVTLLKLLADLPNLIQRPFDDEVNELAAHVQALLDTRFSVAPRLSQKVTELIDLRENTLPAMLTTLEEVACELDKIAAAWRWELAKCAAEHRETIAKAQRDSSNKRKKAIDDLFRQWAIYLSGVDSLTVAKKTESELNVTLSGCGVTVPAVGDIVSEEWTLDVDSRFYDGDKVFDHRPLELKLTNGTQHIVQAPNKFFVDFESLEITPSNEYFVAAVAETTGLKLRVYRDRSFSSITTIAAKCFEVVDCHNNVVLPVLLPKNDEAFSAVYPLKVLSGEHQLRLNFLPSTIGRFCPFRLGSLLSLVKGRKGKCPKDVPINVESTSTSKVSFKLNLELRLHPSSVSQGAKCSLKQLKAAASQVSLLFPCNLSGDDRCTHLKSQFDSCRALTSTFRAAELLRESKEDVKEALRLIVQRANPLPVVDRVRNALKQAIEQVSTASLQFGIPEFEARLAPHHRAAVSKVKSIIDGRLASFSLACFDCTLLINCNDILSKIQSPSFKPESLNLEETRAKLLYSALSREAGELLSDVLEFLSELKSLSGLAVEITTLEAPTADVDHSQLQLLPANGTLEIAVSQSVHGGVMMLRGPHFIDFGSIALNTTAKQLVTVSSDLIGQKCCFAFEVQNPDGENECVFATSAARVELAGVARAGDPNAMQLWIYFTPTIVGSFAAQLTARVSVDTQIVIPICGDCVKPNLHVLMLRPNGNIREPLIVVYSVGAQLDSCVEVVMEPPMEVPLLFDTTVVRSICIYRPLANGVDMMRATIGLVTEESPHVSRFLNCSAPLKRDCSTVAATECSVHQAAVANFSGPLKFDSFCCSAELCVESTSERRLTVYSDLKLLAMSDEHDGKSVDRRQIERGDGECKFFVKLAEGAFEDYLSTSTTIPLVVGIYADDDDAFESKTLLQFFTDLPRPFYVEATVSDCTLTPVIVITPSMLITNLGFVGDTSIASIRVRVGGRVLLYVECSCPRIAVSHVPALPFFLSTPVTRPESFTDDSYIVLPMVDVDSGPFDFTVSIRLEGEAAVERRFVGFKKSTIAENAPQETPRARVTDICLVDNMPRDNADLLMNTFAWMSGRGTPTSASFSVGNLAHLLCDKTPREWPQLLAQCGTLYFADSLVDLIDASYRLAVPSNTSDPTMLALRAVTTGENVMVLVAIEQQLRLGACSDLANMTRTIHAKSRARITVHECWGVPERQQQLAIAMMPPDLSDALFEISTGRGRASPLSLLKAWSKLRGDSLLVALTKQLDASKSGQEIDLSSVCKELLIAHSLERLLLTKSSTNSQRNFVSLLEATRELHLSPDCLKRVNDALTLEEAIANARRYAHTLSLHNRARLEILCSSIERWNGWNGLWSVDTLPLLFVIIGVVLNQQSLFSLAHLCGVVLGFALDPTLDLHDQVEDAIRESICALGYPDDWLDATRASKSLGQFVHVLTLTDGELQELRGYGLDVPLPADRGEWLEFIAKCPSFFTPHERFFADATFTTLPIALRSISESIIPREISSAAASVSIWFDAVWRSGVTPTEAFQAFVGALHHIISARQSVICHPAVTVDSRSLSPPPLVRGVAAVTSEHAVQSCLQQTESILILEKALEDQVNALTSLSSDESASLTMIFDKSSRILAQYDSLCTRFISSLYHRRSLIPFLTGDSLDVKNWVRAHPLSKLIRTGVRLGTANFWLNSLARSLPLDIFDAFPELSRQRKSVIELLAQLQIPEVAELFRKLGIEFNVKPNECSVTKRKVSYGTKDAANTVLVDQSLIIEVERAVMTAGTATETNLSSTCVAPLGPPESTSEQTMPLSPHRVVTGNVRSSSNSDLNPIIGVSYHSCDDPSVTLVRKEMSGANVISLKQVENLFSKVKTIAPPKRAEVHTIPIDAGTNCLSYAAMAQSPQVRRLVNQIAHEFSQMLSKCRSQGGHHHFRWVLFVDNSGSLKKYTSTMRVCVLVLMEVLRKLEVEFNVYGFWQKLSKLYEAKDKKVIDFQAGQRVLEGLVLEGGTNLISCLHEALDLGFGTAPPPKGTHNLLLMLSDCFTSERDIRAVQESDGIPGGKDRVPIGEALRHRQVNMSCLSIGNNDNESITQLLTDLTGRHGTNEAAREPCFTFASIDELEHCDSVLPLRVIGLVNKQTQLEFAAIEKGAAVVVDEDVVKDALARVTAAEITVDATPHLPTDTLGQNIIHLLRNPQERLLSRPSSAIGDGNFTFERDSLAKAPTRPRKPNSHNDNVRIAFEAVHRRTPRSMDDSELAVDKELHKVSSQCRVVIEDIFSCNRYTRKQPSHRGSTLSIRGLVRAAMSNFADTRFFAAKTAGGVRDFNFVVALDTSASMRGPPFVNAVTCVLALAQALKDSGIERFSVVLYGAGIRIVKTVRTPWDSGCKAILLSARCDEYETNDAEMIRFCCEELLKDGRERHLFVFTDGFASSSRTDHSEALHAARSSNIEVTAISCGLEDSGCHESYGRYLTLQHPMELSAGLKQLFSDAPPVPYRTEERIAINLALDHLGDKDYDPLLFQDMLKSIVNATVHDAEVVEIATSGAGVASVVDVAFCLDLTASMTPFLEKTVMSMIALATALASVSEESPLHGGTIRFGVSCFRDFDEDQGPMLAFLPLNTTPPPTQEDHLQALKNFFNLATPDTQVRCFGGNDVAEDIAGGLKRAATLFVHDGLVLSPTANRFLLLLSDAPNHGRAFHPPDCHVSDDYADCPLEAPARGVSILDILEMLKVMKVFTICAGIRPSLTNHFHREMCRIAPKRDGEAMILCGDATELFHAGVAQDRCHFIFALDSSGSMKGSRIAGLKTAFAGFAEKRKLLQVQMTHTDLISVTTHETHAHELVRLRNMGNDADFLETVQKVMSIDAGGGTEFYSGLKWCNDMIDMTPLDCIPVVIFMADGGDCMASGRKANDKFEMVREIVALRPNRPRALLYSIMAFSEQEVDIQVMKEIARHAAEAQASGDAAEALARSTYCGVPSAEQLVSLFSAIGDIKPAANLIDAVTEHVHDVITQAISCRCY